MKGFRQLRSSVLQGQWSSSPTVNRNRKLNRSTYEWKIWFGIEIHLDVLLQISVEQRIWYPYGLEMSPARLERLDTILAKFVMKYLQLGLLSAFE
jgi:hypothetical protein